MTLYEKVITIYPELLDIPMAFCNGLITLQDDLDGEGAYIAEWNYEKPPPTEAQLNLYV
jgi:hypothetical protein